MTQFLTNSTRPMKRFFFTFFCCFFILGIVSSAFRNRNLSLRSEDPWEPFIEQVLSYSLSHSRHGWELDGSSAEATDLYFLEIVQRLLENAVHEKRERMKYNQFNIVTASAQMRIFVT